MMNELLTRASLRRGGVSGKAKAMSGEVWLFLSVVQPSQGVFPIYSDQNGARVLCKRRPLLTALSAEAVASALHKLRQDLRKTQQARVCLPALLPGPLHLPRKDSCSSLTCLLPEIRLG